MHKGHYAEDSVLRVYLLTHLKKLAKQGLRYKYQFMQRVFLILPLMVLPIAVLEAVSNLFTLKLDALFQYFVQNILFLNTLHILITFYLILRFSRFKRILNISINNRKDVFTGFVLLLFFITVALYVLSSKAEVLGLSKQTGRIATFVFAVVSGFLASFHAIWQIRGIGHMKEFSGASRRPQDKKLFSAFVVSILLIKTYFLYSVFSGQTVRPYIVVVLITGSMLLSSVFVIQAYKDKLPRKALFYSRLALFPLSQVSTLGALILPCLHGVEYYYFFKGIKMEEGEVLHRNYQFVLAGLFIILLIPFMPIISRDLKMEYALFLTIATGANYGLSFVHYYLDEKIFSFSNLQIKKELEAVL